MAWFFTNEINSDVFEIYLGTFIDDAFTWYSISKHKDPTEAYKEFKKYVINDFILKYKNGLTPNPCIECNRNLKFGLMFDIAKDYDCSKIATGHYAKIEKCGDRFLGIGKIDLRFNQLSVGCIIME